MDGHAGQDDRPRPDPDVAPDTDWAPKFDTGSSQRRVARMVGREDLHPRPDLSEITNGDLDHVRDHAVEVQKHAHAQADVEALVAVKRWPDHRALPDGGEAFQ